MVFAPEAARHPPQPQAKSTAAVDGGTPGDWGFRFVVDPLHGVHYRVVREFELICRFGGSARAGAGSLTPRTTFGSQVGVGIGLGLTKECDGSVFFFLHFVVELRTSEMLDFGVWRVYTSHLLHSEWCFELEQASKCKYCVMLGVMYCYYFSFLCTFSMYGTLFTD